MAENKHPHHKQVVNRLSRIIGHTQAIKKMVEDDRDCSEILMQIAAVKSALNNTAKVILKDHLNHCLIEAVENKDEESLAQLNQAIDQLIK